MEIEEQRSDLSQTGVVSIIVPAYNAEEHLSECLDSILVQPEVGEVIVIDDGSTDGTRQLVEGYISSDSRVRALFQKRKGVSVARNNGIACAAKRWLAFVDSDDVIPEGAFGRLLGSAKKHNADMVYGNYGVFRKGEVSSWSNEFKSLDCGCISAKYVLRSLADVNPCSVSGSCCRVIFKGSFLKENSISFPEGIAMSEDFAFILECLSSNPSVAYVDAPVYLVRREGGSTTQRYMPSLARDMSYVNGCLRKACEGDSALMGLCLECEANTAWTICVNPYKPGAPYNARGRYELVKGALRQYAEPIAKTRLIGKMPWMKIFMLKLGCIFPQIFWLLLELRRIKGGRHR